MWRLWALLLVLRISLQKPQMQKHFGGNCSRHPPGLSVVPPKGNPFERQLPPQSPPQAQHRITGHCPPSTHNVLPLPQLRRLSCPSPNTPVPTDLSPLTKPLLPIPPTPSTQTTPVMTSLAVPKLTPLSSHPLLAGRPELGRPYPVLGGDKMGSWGASSCSSSCLVALQVCPGKHRTPAAGSFCEAGLDAPPGPKSKCLEQPPPSQVES